MMATFSKFFWTKVTIFILLLRSKRQIHKEQLACCIPLVKNYNCFAEGPSPQTQSKGPDGMKTCLEFFSSCFKISCEKPADRYAWIFNNDYLSGLLIYSIELDVFGHLIKLKYFQLNLKHDLPKYGKSIGWAELSGDVFVVDPVHHYADHTIFPDNWQSHCNKIQTLQGCCYNIPYICKWKIKHSFTALGSQNSEDSSFTTKLKISKDLTQDRMISPHSLIKIPQQISVTTTPNKARASAISRCTFNDNKTGPNNFKRLTIQNNKVYDKDFHGSTSHGI